MKTIILNGEHFHNDCCHIIVGKDKVTFHVCQDDNGNNYIIDRQTLKELIG